MKKNAVVIGYGNQGGWHTRQILSSDVVSLAGIYDIKPERNARAQENGIMAYDSFEAVLADPNVDIVVICVPNNHHKELTEKALLAGKHVICEKPVEMSVRAFDEMVAVSESAGKCFSVHQNRRWDVDFLAMKSIIDSGEIGDLIRIESRVQGSRGIPSDWRGKIEYGGGVLLDWGVHLIDQILCIFRDDPVIWVYCSTTHITNNEVDDGFKLTLDFKSGKTAYAEVGTYNFIAMPRFYMQCKSGSALLTDWKQAVHVAKMTAWNEKDVLPVQTAAGITKTMAPRDEVTLQQYDVPRPASDVHEYYRNFCAAIDGREELTVKLSEVRRCLRVMEAAFASADAHQVLKVTI